MRFSDIEVCIIKKIQNLIYTEEYNIIEKTAKVISSRKFRKVYLIFYFLYLLYIENYSKLIIVPHIYILGYLSRQLYIYIKLIFKRSRPYLKNTDILINEETAEKKKLTYSLPSNSIQTSLIFYNTLLNSIELPSSNIHTCLLTLVFLITSIAKINRGLHYPSDILVSFLIFYFIT